jgi:hypothetical protein
MYKYAKINNITKCAESKFAITTKYISYYMFLLEQIANH